MRTARCLAACCFLATPLLAAETQSRLLHFEPAAEDGFFVARGPGYSLRVGPASTFVALAPRAVRPGQPAAGGPVLLAFRLVGADAEAQAEPRERQPGLSHYYRGSDPARWRLDVPHFARVAYRGVYPGTDVVHYGHEGSLEHDYVVAAGADPGRIRFTVEGARSLHVDGGALVVATPLGDVRLDAPVAYQVANGSRSVVSCAYRLDVDGQVSFRLGAFDEHRPLVIDPVLSYASFAGGSADDTGLDVVLAADRSIWLSGTTFSADLPGAGNGHGGDQDAFVSHLSPDGQTLLSTTYLGGTGADFGNRIRVTRSGVYLVGGTVSDDFPSPDASCTSCRNPPPGLASWELYYSPSDSQSFLVKLDKGGRLAHAVVYGGSALDNAWVLDLDDLGRILVGSTSCGDGFPTTPGAFRENRTPAASGSNPDDGCDVAIAAFRERAAGFRLAYGTYLGGSGGDFVAGLAADPSGAAWVVGGTTSLDFPTTRRAHRRTSAGDFDAFVARVAPNGRSLDVSTYVGGTGYDYPFDVGLDGSGDALVVGRTESADFPTTPGAYQAAPAGSSDGFVARVTRVGRLGWSTRLAGSGFDWPFAVAVRRDGGTYVTGFTDSTDFPSLLPAQPGPGGDSDAFVVRLNAAGSAVRWSTLLGGPGFDQGHGIALDGRGGIWIAGGTAGGLNPTPDAAQSVYGGGGSDALLLRLDESASVRVAPAGIDFPTTRVGRTRGPRRVWVRDTGRASVDILGTSLSGPEAGDFAVTRDCPGTIDPGQTCVIEVTFSPGAVGPRSASLLVATSASAAPVTVPLAGSGR